MGKTIIFREGNEAMVVVCEDVWREVSNYFDGELAPELRAGFEEHVRGCKRCSAVVDGTRNVIRLYSDPRMLEMPLGFSRRLHQRLQGDVGTGRRPFLGWAAAAAAAILVAGAFEVSRLSVLNQPRLRSAHAPAYNRVPPDMMVLAARDGKVFHVAGCKFIHGKDRLRTLTAREAEQLGYTPCVRCMKKYLDTTAALDSEQDENDLARNAPPQPI
jgi:hypothetical protein